MRGEPLIVIAQHIHHKEVSENARRGSQDPLPRAIAVTSEAFRFELPLIAGALSALTLVSREHESDAPWDLPDEAVGTLNLLPLAVRSGADTPESLAWIRAGVHNRVVAHQLDDLFPALTAQSDDELRRWACGRPSDIHEGARIEQTTAFQADMIAALRKVRDAW